MAYANGSSSNPLDSLRNVSAHNVEVEDVDARVAVVIRLLWPDTALDVASRPRRFTTLRNAIMLVCVFLEGMGADGFPHGAARNAHRRGLVEELFDDEWRGRKVEAGDSWVMAGRASTSDLHHRLS